MYCVTIISGLKFKLLNSVKIPATSQNARVNLSQYIVRHPVSLKIIFYVKKNSTVIYRTKYNAYWGENIKLFKAVDFIAELTMHIPPKYKHHPLLWAVFQQIEREGK